MNKAEKQAEVGKLKEQFLKARILLLTDYKGLKVSESSRLRLELHSKGASRMKVVKNRLAKIAVKGTVLEFLTDFFRGTTAVTTTEGDPAQTAKILVKFAKDNEKVKFKAAGMDGKPLTEQQIKALATLPSREELLARLAGSMQAPARNWVTVLAQIPRRVVNVLAAIRDKKQTKDC
ncbi:MAG: 50S ribosomal protein L10 [Deltaproteobacteria bacterium]|nr:50S ribosomal protein L10 [Deltaproteobacteria bacterium]